jgi:hypothetical protein
VEKEKHLSSDIVTKLRDDTRHVLWAQDRVRLYAADYIERLEVALKAADELAKRAEQTGRLIHDLAGLSLSSLHANDVAVRPLEASRAAYDTARARVNLSSQAALDNSKKEATNGKA